MTNYIYFIFFQALNSEHVIHGNAEFCYHKIVDSISDIRNVESALKIKGNYESVSIVNFQLLRKE